MASIASQTVSSLSSQDPDEEVLLGEPSDATTLCFDAPSNRTLETHDGDEIQPLKSEGLKHDFSSGKTHGQMRKTPRHLKTPQFSYIDDWWLLEIAGAVFSMMCFAAIVGILSIYHNKPLSEWRWSIKINSMIALFATLAKTTILLPITVCIGQLKWRYFAARNRRLSDLQIFDDASRGPLGAFQLITKLEGRQRPVIATCAAIITVSALAIDPFAQQIISYPTRSSPVTNSSATVVHTQIYDRYQWSAFSSQDTDTPHADVKMQGAVYRGLFDLPSEPTFKCPTGDCYWPPFASLAICSQCTDITARCSRQCFNFTDTGNGFSFTPASPDYFDQGRLMCNYTTPSDLSLWSWFAYNPDLPPWTTVINSSGDLYPIDNPSYADIVTIIILKIPPAPDTRSAQFPQGHVHECHFTWCAKTYSNVRVRNGTLSGDVPVISKLRGDSEYETNKGSRYMVMKVQNPTNYPRTWNDTFTVNILDDSNIGALLGALFTINQYSWAEFGTEPGSISLGPALQHAENISDVMRKVADSMTTRIRAATNGTQLFGTATQEITYIDVRWPWLILPAAVIFCGCILLVTLILMSSKTDIAIWKSSSLALLFHGLSLQDDGFPTQQEEDLTRKLSDMQNTAGKMRVQLCFAGVDDDDLKLVVDESPSSPIKMESKQDSG